MASLQHPDPPDHVHGAPEPAPAGHDHDDHGEGRGRSHAPRDFGGAAVPVGRWLLALPGVAEVHDLHIRAISTTEDAPSAHPVHPAGFPGDGCPRGI